MSEPLVSVSGVRGIVGESFTEEVVRKWARALGEWINDGRATGFRGQGSGDRRIVLGRDTRPSGEWALRIARKVLADNDVQPIEVGIVPTPTVQLAVTYHQAAAGLIITASHNPVEWNGLKFLGSDGVFLNAEEMEQLREGVGSGVLGVGTANEDTGFENQVTKIVTDDEAIRRHIENVLNLPIIVEKVRARKFRIVVDPVNGTGALAVPPLLEQLGCSVMLINGEPDGNFAHPPEPTPANLSELGEQVKAERADLGVAVDPDADRLVLVDETGKVLSEEYTVTLAAYSAFLGVQRTGFRGQKTIVVNLSTTRMVDDVAKRFGATVIRTAVGERHVVDGMRKHQALIGGEGNGGVIFPLSHEGRDSLVGIALILDLLAQRNTTLSNLVQEFPRYVMRKDKLPRGPQFDTEKIAQVLRQKFPDSTISTMDGIRLDTREGWIHLRPSNTEPVVRLIGEAETEKGLVSLMSSMQSLAFSNERQ